MIRLRSIMTRVKNPALYRGVLTCAIWVFIILAPLEAAARSGPILTPDEKAWLADHDGEIRLAPAPDWEPMEFFDENGAYQGLVADYIRLIEERLNITFRIVRTPSWAEILAKAKRKEIDVIPAAQPTADRRKFMIWSSPYFHVKTTIIVRKEVKKQLSLEKMEGMRIGVPREYAVGEFVRKTYPDLTFVSVENNKSGLYKLSFGELEAMITEVPNALYVIEKEKITNLRLAGDTGFELNQGIGVRDDWPLFAGIIEKTLADISDAEHKEIYSRWVRLETDPFYKHRTFWYSVAAIFAFVVGLVGTVVAWNRTLQRQVKQRTEAVRFNEMRLDALLQLNERPNDSFQEIIEFAFHQMIRLTKSRFGYLAFDNQEGMIYSVQSSDTASQKHPTTTVTSGFTIETQGLWGEAVRLRKAVISNDYSVSNPMKKGLPKGYRTLSRYMNVPIFKGDRVVVVAGVGNKSQDYDTSDLRQLTLLAEGLRRRLQRKQVEQALAREEKNLRDIVENSPNGITIIQNGRVVYRNSKQLQLAGEITLNRNIKYDHIHSEDRDAARNFYESILAGQPEETELDFKFYTSLSNRTKENLKWVTTLVTPIKYRDDKAFLLTTIDRTRARELEHLLTVQDKMASLGRVAAGIGHEVRNPLSGINIYLRSIEKGLADPTKAHKIAPAISAIRTASSKMEAVVKRVIDFSKPIEPKFVATDVNEPVQYAATLAGLSMGKRGVTMTTGLAEEIAVCYAEPNLIEEVVLNLINNAVDAMEGQETPRHLRLLTYSRKECVYIIVEDTGPGVPVDLAEKIFEPFYTTKNYSTGIGLSLCHRIITDHKGKIRVEAAQEGGARFVVELPAAEDEKDHFQSQPRIQS